ncbi:MAG: AAA family ATPase, partial [Ignavibacteriales bacterium]|nr:AAA family ATPase [Ignavibacteriales bacterium]
MNLTSEQEGIINSKGNIKINAVAGSGKTTTIIEYAKAQPLQKKILYLAFNRSVKLEAIKKFSDKGLDNVRVETAHSLAFKNIVNKYGYKIKANGYKTYEVAELLGLKVDGDKHIELIIANHINKLLAYFCNSDKQKVKYLNYIATISDNKAATFIQRYYNFIEKQARIFLGKMDKGEIEITHDFYLKKFQLSNPKLDYDYILFDEGQDASPAMLDVFFKQKAIKVIVGDTHQQIYGWRWAVNSLERADYKTYFLSTSFRFEQDIANLAIEILKWKNHLFEQQPFEIIGKGKNDKIKTRAVIARTNLGLLVMAIENVVENKKIKNIYFEGNINSYTYADEGASLYDILNLYNDDRKYIKDALIKQMKDMDELEDYIEKTEDMQLRMMADIVKKYGNAIPEILRIIKSKHVENNEKEKAQVVFSTVHRCKGMEYDEIELADDFITEARIEKMKTDFEEKGIEFDKEKINEEINLLYVAVTRARYLIKIPQKLMPKNFPKSSCIVILSDEILKEKRKKELKIKSYSYEGAREKHKKAYESWTDDEDEELAEMYYDG